MCSGASAREGVRARARVCGRRTVPVGAGPRVPPPPSAAARGAPGTRARPGRGREAEEGPAIGCRRARGGRRDRPPLRS